MFTGIYLVFTQVLLCLTGFYLVLLGFDFAPVHLGCASDGTGPVGIVPSCSFLFSFFCFMKPLVIAFFFSSSSSSFFFFSSVHVFGSSRSVAFFERFLAAGHFFFLFTFSFLRSFSHLSESEKFTDSAAETPSNQFGRDGDPSRFFFFAHRLHDARFLFVRHRPSPDQ